MLFIFIFFLLMRENIFENSIFINPLGFAMVETRHDYFPVPAPAISFERDLKEASLYFESNLLFFVAPLNIEVGAVKYLSGYLEGFFISAGVEYWWGDLGYYLFSPDFAIRTPLNVGYRWNFDSGLSIKAFVGTGILYIEKQKWGSDNSWRMEKFTYPDIFGNGVQFGYSW